MTRVFVYLFWLLLFGYSFWLLKFATYFWLLIYGYSFWLLMQCELQLTSLRALQNGYHELKRPKMGFPVGLLGDPWGPPGPPLIPKEMPPGPP